MAMRYLRGAQGRREGRGFLRFIMYVAVGGVAVGVAALLLALSIVRGFSSEIEEKIIGFGAHVQVQNSFQSEPIEDAARLVRELSSWQAVRDVRPVVQDVALLRKSSRVIDGVVLRGTPVLSDYLQRHLVRGTGTFAPDTSARAGLVVGASLAQRLGLEVGDLVTLFAVPEGSEAAGGQGFMHPQVEQLLVTGVYETALSDFDDLYVFTEIGVARELLGVAPGAVTRLDLTLRDVSNANEVARRVEEAFGFPVLALTIYQAFSGLFAWVNLQESITPLVIGVIILVAAFNVIGTLLMMMVEKTREIGVLESLGASAGSIRRLFLALGLLIGLAGTLIGEGLALGLALVQEYFEVIPLPAEAYYMTTAPVELNALDFLLVGALALLLCAAASYIPARVAARIEPVRAIRFD